MKAREMRDKTPEELAKLLADWREELFSLSVRSMTGQVEKASHARRLKKDIARALTVMREQASGGAETGKGSESS